MESMQEAKKFEAEIANLISETMRLNAETMKIQAESKWYPFVVLAGVVGASIGIVKLFSS